MKQALIKLLFLGLLPVQLQFVFSEDLTRLPLATLQNLPFEDPEPGLKQQAFEILKAKCNVCHRRKNPFKIFSLKNMDRHAPKIYKQVFVKRRMPKGDKVKLTEAEYQTLENWLKSKNIF